MKSPTFQNQRVRRQRCTLVTPTNWFTHIEEETQLDARNANSNQKMHDREHRTNPGSDNELSHVTNSDNDSSDGPWWDS